MAQDSSTNEAVLAAQSGYGNPTITLVNLRRESSKRLMV
jgi:hypothetical protein